MREIKFRAWATTDMVSRWAKPGMYTGWSFEDIYSGRDERTIQVEKGPDGKACELPMLADWDCMEIMQYTGLKDAQGNEIYESDILSDGKNVAFVLAEQWAPYSPFGVYGFTLSSHELNLEQHEDLTIIGNIHQNPELVEKENGERQKRQDA